MFQFLVGTLWKPEVTFTELVERGSARQGALAVCVSGAAWSALTLLLHFAGHAPSVTLVPIPRSEYYLWQSLFVVPLLLCLWLLAASVAHGLSRLFAAPQPFSRTATVLGFSYAAPLLVFFILPDFVIYATLGFEALSRAARWYAPLTPLATLVLTSLGLRAVHGLRLAPALGIALVALSAQALVGGLLLR